MELSEYEIGQLAVATYALEQTALANFAIYNKKVFDHPIHQSKIVTYNGNDYVASFIVEPFIDYWKRDKDWDFSKSFDSSGIPCS